MLSAARATTKRIGPILYARENNVHKVTLRIVSGHQSSAAYDFVLAWGDGTPDLERSGLKGKGITGKHRYGAAGSTYPLTGTVKNAITGKSDTVSLEVRVVTEKEFIGL